MARKRSRKRPRRLKSEALEALTIAQRKKITRALREKWTGKVVEFIDEHQQQRTGLVLGAKKGLLVMLSPAPLTRKAQFKALGMKRSWWEANWKNAREQHRVGESKIVKVIE